MKELKDMTAKELEDYKRKLYKDNTDNGNIQKLYTIGRKFGADFASNYGPKYLLNEGQTEIFIDDYGGYMTVKVNGKLKVSTHNEKLYVPGEWEGIISRLWPKASAKQYQDSLSTEDKRKQDLLDQLS